MWPNNYMSIKFKDKGRDEYFCDCWGLVRLIYQKELGIILPDYLDCYSDTKDNKAIADKIDLETKAKWVEVTTPEEFDVVLLSLAGFPMHVGVVTKPQYMIHCSKDVNTSQEKYTSFKWKNNFRGFYRYEQPTASNSVSASIQQ